MCGRYTLTTPGEQLQIRFHITHEIGEFQPRYNIGPGQLIPAIISDKGENRLGLLKWGLVPSWAKDVGTGFKTINAKSETVREKPAFKRPFERKRCMIPADGFYEWKNDGNRKQPMRIVLKNRGLFAMAGLYDTWTAPDGSKLHTCTILTTRPNKLMEPIHNRMPVILRPEDESVWLDRERFDPELLQSFFVPYPEEEMFAYPVSSIVGNVRNDLPECIEPVTDLLS
jgi:putative SOS response-associated peptidase YedK